MKTRWFSVVFAVLFAVLLFDICSCALLPKNTALKLKDVRAEETKALGNGALVGESDNLAKEENTDEDEEDRGKEDVEDFDEDDEDEVADDGEEDVDDFDEENEGEDYDDEDEEEGDNDVDDKQADGENDEYDDEEYDFVDEEDDAIEDEEDGDMLKGLSDINEDENGFSDEPALKTTNDERKGTLRDYS